MALTSAQATGLADGTVTDWRDVGATARPLRVGSLQDVRADRNVVAVVPAQEVGPPCRWRPWRVSTRCACRRRTPCTNGRAPPTVTTVTVTGDVMLGRGVGARLAQVRDPAAALRPMARRLAGADLTIGNLESTLSRAGAPRQGGDSFAAAPSVRSGLTLAGFDVLSLANNHTGDFGLPALVETVRRVRAGGFVPVGAGSDLARAARPASSSATASGSGWWLSTRSARRRAATPDSRVRCGCGCSRAPDR